MRVKSERRARLESPITLILWVSEGVTFRAQARAQGPRSRDRTRTRVQRSDGARERRRAGYPRSDSARPRRKGHDDGVHVPGGPLRHQSEDVKLLTGK